MAVALCGQLQKLWKWVSAPPKEPIDDSADWYGGLAVDPSSFSRQLIQLQTSLRAERARRMESPSQATVEKRSIEFGSESAA